MFHDSKCCYGRITEPGPCRGWTDGTEKFQMAHQDLRPTPPARRPSAAPPRHASAVAHAIGALRGNNQQQIHYMLLNARGGRIGFPVSAGLPGRRGLAAVRLGYSLQAA